MFQLAWPWLLIALALPWLAWRLLPPAHNGWGGVVFLPIAGALSGLDEPLVGHGLRAWLRWGALLCWLLLCWRPAARSGWGR